MRICLPLLTVLVVIATSVAAKAEAEPLPSGPAAEVPGPKPEIRSRQLILLVPQQLDPAETDGFVTALESQLRGLLVALEVERVSAAAGSLEQGFEDRARELAARPGTLLVFWIAPGSGDRVLFHTSAEVGGVSFDRRFGDIVDRVRAEVFALIVRASAQAILEGRGVVSEPAPEPEPEPAPESGPIPEPEPAPEPEPRPRPEPKAHKWIGLEAAYAFDLYSAEHPAGSGLHLGLRVHVTPSWLLLVDFRVMQPVKRSTEGVKAELHRHPLAIGAAYRWLLGDASVNTGLHLTLDFEMHETSVTGPLLVYGEDRVKLAAMFAARIRAGYRVFGPLRLFAEIGLEVSLKRIRWSASLAGRKAVLFDPWPVHPRALAGLSVEVW